MRRPATTDWKPLPLAATSLASSLSTAAAASGNGPAVADRKNRRRSRVPNGGSRSGSAGQNAGNSKNPSLSRQSQSYYPVLFLGFVILLVAADLLYLARISSQAFASLSSDSVGPPDPNHPSTWTRRTKTVRVPRNASELEAEGAAAGLHNLDDKGPILKILHQAGLNIDDFDQEIIDDLPTWTQVQSLYGTGPILIGLEKCKEFVASTDPTVRFFGVAGTFNSGTNLVAELLTKNCQITERMLVYGNESRGVRWQVPWGKHYPASHRGQHVTSSDRSVPYTNSLPLVAVREPYMWLQSMCRHIYTARWPHTKKHCPNLIATANEIENLPELRARYLDRIQEDSSGHLVPVKIKYQDTIYHHNSLAHFWSEWYQQYMDADFPRIMVRFEDLLFYGEEVTNALCECGGGVPREDRPSNLFVHISDSAKLGTRAHGKDKTNLLGAILRYGNFDHRLDNMTADDLVAARKYFDRTIMETFGYHHPEAIDD